MSRTGRQLPFLDRDDIQTRIAQGQCIVIYRQHVLRLEHWIPYHPGGDKAIHHLVGMDGTDPMNSYHSGQTQERMLSFAVGKIHGQWENMVPPVQVQAATTDTDVLDLSSEVNSIDANAQTEIVKKYRELDAELRKSGLYQCNYWAYGREGIRYAGLFVCSMILLHYGFYTLSAVLLGCFWHQLTFTAHDAGHMGITHDYFTDNIIGFLIADWLGGLSLGWWKRNHNVHHFVTNHPEHDPDIQHLPFFAISSKFLRSLRSSFYERVMPFDKASQFFVPIQHYLYYPVLCFGRFNLYILSWDFIIAGRGPRRGQAAWTRWFELCGLCFFWYWFGYEILYKRVPTTGLKVLYVLVSHIVTMPLHVQITLSHFAMCTKDLGIQESFPQKMLRTTMDVDCPEWLDFIHGGLQFQAVHHLFPRLPRHNLRTAQPLVRKFCGQVGLRYHIYGFTHGNKQVLGKLAQVAKQARIMNDAIRALQNN